MDTSLIRVFGHTILGRGMAGSFEPPIARFIRKGHVDGAVLSKRMHGQSIP